MRRVLLIWLLAVGLAAAQEPWVRPAFERVSSKSALSWSGKHPLSGQRKLYWAERPQGTFFQLNRGKSVLWRVRAQVPGGLSLTRAEAQNSRLVVLRSLVNRLHQGREFGDLAFALNLRDGSLAWMTEPIPATRERPGEPNVQRADRLYETYLSRELAPLVMVRRLSDGKPIFWRDIPNPDDQPFDLVERRIYHLNVHADGLQVSLADKFRHWQTYLFSLQDGTLKSSREGVAGPGDKLFRDSVPQP